MLLAVLVVGLGTCYLLHSVLDVCLGYQECLHVHPLLERCEASWMGAMKTWAPMNGCFSELRGGIGGGSGGLEIGMSIWVRYPGCGW